MPIDYSKYPKDWKQIRQRILDREGHKCKFCGVPNHEVGNRGKSGAWWSDVEQAYFCNEHDAMPDGIPHAGKLSKIVLTIAHLNHDISDNSGENLAALCQRCHLRHDAEHHATNAKATRDHKRGQPDVFEGGNSE